MKKCNPAQVEDKEKDREIASMSGAQRAAGEVLKSSAEAQDKKQESTMFDTWKGK